MSKQSGFTIIELLISTVIFSVIMLVITTAILQFSKQYYKGVVANATQGASRAVIDDISRAIQFNGGEVYTIANGFCVGNAKRYSYVIGKQVVDSGALGPNQSRHALVSDNISGCNVSTTALPVTALPANLSTYVPALSNGREQLGEKMRLASLKVAGSNGLYTIGIRIVYGDDDLLCSPVANDCASTATTTNLTAPDLTCKSTIGSQFCAVSELSTTVRKRVN